MKDHVRNSQFDNLFSYCCFQCHHLTLGTEKVTDKKGWNKNKINPNLDKKNMAVLSKVAPIYTNLTDWQTVCLSEHFYARFLMSYVCCVIRLRSMVL